MSLLKKMLKKKKKRERERETEKVIYNTKRLGDSGTGKGFQKRSNVPAMN